MKKLFTSPSQTITGAALILGAASLVSRVIGMLRDRILAHYFGAGDVLDAYYAAFRIPDFVYNLLIAGALSAGFIPVFLTIWGKDKQEAWRVTNGILNILGFLLLITCGILFLFTPALITYTVPGFSEEKRLLTITLTRIMFISPILLGLSSVISGVLQSVKSFFIYSITPILYNVGIIFGTIYLSPSYGPKGLAYGVIIGALLHLLVQLPTLYAIGFRYKWIFPWKHPSIREMGRLMIPRTLGLAATQINFVVMTMIGSILGSGAIAIFTLANNLQYVAVGSIGVSFAIAAFPTLSLLAAEQKKEEIAQHIARTTRYILFCILPITILFLLLRAQIVRVILGTGAFDWNATILTMNTLAFFSFSLFAQCLIPLLARVFYALHDTWTPFLISLLSTIITISLSFLFRDQYGVLGLALAFSLSSVFQLTIMWVLLRQTLGTLNELPILHTLYKLSLAGMCMSLTIQFLKEPLADIVDMATFWGVLTQATLSGGIGLLIYGIFCYILRVDEIRQLYATVTSRMYHKNIPGEIESK
ncbi:MAG TPA: murein biosynthesis integral membrane protein MurJ [Candidatus Kapabacteria bacterium]|nr:murein biosynthesis integral membrane protein MurJ [Candidatus Kapabacteria bacterium]